MKTTAKRDGNEYVINGSKTFITNGGTANLIIVVCKTDPAAGAKGISLVVVETDEVEGFRRGRILDKLGQKAQDTAELFFDEVKVPTDKPSRRRRGPRLHPAHAAAAAGAPDHRLARASP